MQLKEYPAAIAKAANQVRAAEGDVWEARNTTTLLNYQIESTIAADSDLKNDQQRKAKKLELQQGDEWLTASQTLRRAEANLVAAEIQANLLRDLFRVELLELRDRVARLEASRMIA